MVWASLLLTLVTYFSGSFAQTEALRQPPAVSVSLEKNAQITCSGDLVGEESVSWYQQKPGMAPVFIIYLDDTRPSGISDRFSDSKSGNTATLTISRAKVEDEADYYCQVWDNGRKQYIFGGGTQLTVTGGPPSPPTVNLYCPSKEEMTSKGTGTLVCSITGFSPSAIETAWVAGGTPISNGVQTTKPIKDNDKYMATSYLPVTAREWERGNSYTCKVRHEEQDYMKSVSQSQCP